MPDHGEQVSAAGGAALERVFNLGLTAVLALVGGFLGWVALTNTAEYFDGYEYLRAGEVLWGDAALWRVKNVLFEAVAALVYAPFHFAGVRPTLVPFHAVAFALSCGYLYFAVRWLRSVVPALAWPVALALAAGNRLVMHYASFMLPDLTSALTVVAWLAGQARTAEGRVRGVWPSAAWLAAMALCRPNSLVIPAVVMLVDVVRDRARVRHHARAAALGACLAFAGFVLAQAVARRTDPASALLAGLHEMRSYAANTASQEGQPWWVYGPLLALVLTVPGCAAALWGLGLALRRRGEGGVSMRVPRSHAAGVLLACLVFVLAMTQVGQKEARYLAQVLPGCLLLQALALARLRGWRPWLAPAAALVVFLAASPEALRFLDPFYRADLARATSERIASWSGQREAVFATPRGTFHPRERLFHWNDRYFYLFHWAAAALEFHSGVVAVPPGAPITFRRYGYPVPDGIEHLAPARVPIIVAADAGDEHVTSRPTMGHVVALRWRPRAAAPGADAECLPSVTRVCVEALIAFDGHQP